MRLPQVDNKSFAPAENKLLRFNPNKLGPMMQMLASMYSAAEDAVVRELVCNAYDAKVAAGSSRPVELVIPDERDYLLGSKMMTVTDYGTGLSADAMSDVFGGFGESTKEYDDNAIGAYGVGAKSPYAINESFTVISNKDGLSAQAAFTLDDQGRPQVGFWYKDRPTDAPNGTTVQVPIKSVTTRARLFAAVARRLGFFPTGAIVFNGEPVTSVTDSLHWVNRTTATLRNSEAPTYLQNKHTVVMGHVAYPLDTPAYGNTYVHMVPAGTVLPDYNRESLKSTLHNERVAARLTTTAAKDRHEAFETLVAQAPNSVEAYLLAREWGISNNWMWGERRYGRQAVEADYFSLETTNASGARRARPTVEHMKAISASIDRHHMPVVLVVGDDREVPSRAAMARFCLRTQAAGILVADAPTGRTEWFYWGDDSPVRVYDLDSFAEHERAQAAEDRRNAPPRAKSTYRVIWTSPDDDRRRDHLLTIDEIRDLVDELSPQVLGIRHNSESYMISQGEFWIVVKSRDMDKARQTWSKRLKREVLPSGDVLVMRQQAKIDFAPPEVLELVNNRVMRCGSGVRRILGSLGNPDLERWCNVDSPTAAKAREVFDAMYVLKMPPGDDPSQPYRKVVDVVEALMPVDETLAARFARQMLDEMRWR